MAGVPALESPAPGRPLAVPHVGPADVVDGPVLALNRYTRLRLHRLQPRRCRVPTHDHESRVFRSCVSACVYAIMCNTCMHTMLRV